MATYVIGDVQGCFRALQALLAECRYRPSRDILWFAGDLVNRGPDSLDTLRFVADLGERAVTVLGNHDLHLLALWKGAGRGRAGDTLDSVLEAPDASRLLGWLQHQPLLHRDTGHGVVMAHAGLLPAWSTDAAEQHARLVEAQLAIADGGWFQTLYGNAPALWEDRLTGPDRARLIINVFTRMRFLDAQGGLDFHHKGAPEGAPAELRPWFLEDRARPEKIVFGHWSALGIGARGHHFSLDGGCVWGGRLGALRLDDWQSFSVPCDRCDADAPGGESNA